MKYLPRATAFGKLKSLAEGRGDRAEGAELAHYIPSEREAPFDRRSESPRFARDDTL